MAAPDEREFITFLRGQVRDDVILASMRNDMRAHRNPDTGLPFTEDEIARATQPGSRFYAEADAIDLYGQARQVRALYLADQVDPRRSSGAFLEQVHGELWLGPGSKQKAEGASGAVAARGVPGTTFVGSPNVPDPSAAVATGPSGKKYQVLASASADAAGDVELAVQAVDAGSSTDLAPGSLLTWSANTPLGAEPTAAVLQVPGSPGAGLEGGVDDEDDQHYGDRVADRILARPASGNAAHFQAWARRASSSVERAFVYPAAMHAGSVVLAPTQVRTAPGPTARLPAVGVLAAVSNYVVPPSSPVVPEHVYVLVVAPRAQPVDLVVRVSMSAGSGGGWKDVVPWPSPALPASPEDVEQVQVDAVASQLQFTVVTDAPLPANSTLLAGSEAPQLMVWDDGLSRFERLLVSSVGRVGPTVTVSLLAAPQKTLAPGDRISPYTDRADQIAEAHVAYFDSLGPGELVAAGDSRRPRSARRPRPQQEFAQRAGQGLVATVVDVLGGTASDADLTRISRTDPDPPGSVVDGPNMLTLGRLNVYPL